MSRTLLDTIGVTDEAKPADVEIDLSRWSQLVLRSLETEYNKEASRLTGRRR